jgi:DnaK suppressor protein
VGGAGVSIDEMKRIDLKKYETSLGLRAADVEQALGRRHYIAVQSAPDELDQVQLAADRELAVQNLDSNFRLLRQIEAARKRIRDGSYGACLRCEEPIAPKRLDALPWAAYCVRCQEIVDGADERVVEARRVA